MNRTWKSLVPGISGTKKIITEFADRAGMVYFGFVSQRDDDHHIVRGMTVSTKHTDNHYCVGTYEGYDVVFVERSDTLHSGRKHDWHIMEFDLQSRVDLPHIFIRSNARNNGFQELMRVKYPSLQPVPLGTFLDFPSSFTSSFTTYASLSRQITVEQLLAHQIAPAFERHFKGFVVEISDQSLYVYSEKAHVSPELLDTMLQNGRWLAEQIDINSRQA